MQILLVEDDQRLAPVVKGFLEDFHWQVTWCKDGASGWSSFCSLQPDVVLLDVMLPGKDGFTLCQEIRKRAKTPILFLTARGDEMDRVLGLELGADDYLTKPFGLKELHARIKALLRRSGWQDQKEDNIYRRLGPFLLDLEERRLFHGQSPVDLTRSEFDILELLTRHPGHVCSREVLLEQIRGGTTDAFDRAVDTHVSNLRKKMEPNPKDPEFIQTVWGIGYRFQKP